MSYSLAVKAATKELAKQAVQVEFDKMVALQPIHSRDRAAALANANTVIDLLADDDTKGIAVSFNGYVSWGAGDDQPLSTVSVSCAANHTARATDHHPV